MTKVANEGRTILFVSHSMAAIQSLCSRAILLKEGSIAFDGSAEETIKNYLASIEQLSLQPLDTREDRAGGKEFRFESVQFLDSNSMTPCQVLFSGQPVTIRIGYLNRSGHIIKGTGIGIAFFTMTGTHLCGCRSRAVGVTLDVPLGKGYTDCQIPRWPLHGGHYSYYLFADQGGNTLLDWVKEAGSVHVETGDYYGSGFLPSAGTGVFIDYSWRRNSANPIKAASFLRSE